MFMSFSRLVTALFVVAMQTVPAAAQQYYEPARGSQERREILDAVRSEVEYELGSPVEFVVDELRIRDGLAFFMLSPQRPGGAEITPPAGGYYENTGVTGFAAHWKGYWYNLEIVIGATDVWFWDGPYCRFYREVIPEWCPE